MGALLRNLLLALVAALAIGTPAAAATHYQPVPYAGLGTPLPGGKVWALHMPDNGVAIASNGAGRLRFTVRDDGRSWYVDQAAGRTAQRAEIVTPRGFAPGSTLDVSYRLTVTLANMVSRDQAYICLGQIQNVLQRGDKPTPPPVWLTMHGAEPDGRQRLWLVTTSQTGGQHYYGPFPYRLGDEVAVRMRALVAQRGKVTLWLNGQRVVNMVTPLGFTVPHQQIVALGIYTGERGIPIGSGRSITAWYRGIVLR